MLKNKSCLAYEQPYEVLEGLVNPLGALSNPYKALKGLIRVLQGPYRPCTQIAPSPSGCNTLPSFNVDLNPKSEMAISRQFSMNFSNRIDESLSFSKAFQMVITIGARTSKIAPRSSRYPPGSRSRALLAL